MSARLAKPGRLVLLALVGSGAIACGSILGIGDPTLESDGGGQDAAPEANSGGGDSTIPDGPSNDGSETSTEASGPDATQDAGAEAGDAADAAEAEACPEGQIVCSSGCVDPTSDPNNCNGCNNVCIHGQSCVAGVCQCPSGESTCPGSDGGMSGDAAVIVTLPYCANLGTDPLNCNTCGSTCPVANDTPACVDGGCTVGTCETGFADCNGNPDDGCEVDTLTDFAHCGGCNSPCSAGQLCSDGTCVFTCPTGQQICHTSVEPDGGIADSGADAHTDAGTHPDASADASADAHADSGGGGSSTGTPYCATLASDPTNCGACGTECSTVCVGNVSSFTCNSGTCGVGSCTPGYFNIDGICSNGCECQASSLGTCASPIPLGTLTPGTNAPASGNLVPSGAETYYRITFTGNAASNYHPRISFTLNMNDEYVFDVVTGCSGQSLTCMDLDGGKSVGLTEWETQYQSGVQFTSPGFQAIPPLGTVLIHVYRAPGAPVDCIPYSLLIDN